MEKGYQKSKIAILRLSEDILERSLGENLDTVINYSKKFELSLGTIQKALMNLVENEIIGLEKKGKLGTLISWINYKELLKLLNYNYLLCVMPITYSQRYKKLLNTIENRFRINIPIYFAHMRGGHTRIELIENGVFHFGIVSKLTAVNSIKNGAKLSILGEFGKKSYVKKHVILKGKEEIINVGIDKESDDYLILTNHNFQKNENLNFVDIRYSDVIERLIEGNIDAAIWNYDDVLDKEKILKIHNIEIIELKENVINELATEAVIVAREDNNVIKNIFIKFYNN